MNKSILFIFTLTLNSTLSFADDLDRAPPGFQARAANADAVFVDFQNANHRITFNVTNRTAIAVSEIEFMMPVAGNPIFDVIENPTSLQVDGTEVGQMEIPSPDNQTNFRVILARLEPGNHRMTMTTSINEGVRFDNQKVSAGFFFNDLDNRQFLEMYLPTNFEFDRYARTFEVQVMGTQMPHRVYANGTQIELGLNSFRIEYPAYYTTTSGYFHLVPVSSVTEMESTFTSMDGRSIPVKVYTKRVGGVEDLGAFSRAATATLSELESDYGRFPHATVTIYASNSGGGMEYCGATVTSMRALSHELTHSYFGRGLMPSNGNAGWIDEALASWRDKGYQSTRTTDFISTQMAGHSAYQRETDDLAYTSGASFMAHMDYLLKARDSNRGLKIFLADRLAVVEGRMINRLFMPWTTPDFQADLESFYGSTLSAQFDQYIYGVRQASFSTQSRNSISIDREVERMENPYHPRLTPELMEQLL